MPLHILPDSEAVVGNYLRAVPEVFALVGSRVGTRKHPSWDVPLVRLQRFGGRSEAHNTLDLARLQFGCYGTDEVQAWQVAATVQAALDQAPGHQFDGGMISEVRQEMGPIPVPDAETNEPRYLVQAVVWIRSAP